MPHQPDDNSPDSWHRFFAIENNNLAWELAAKPARTKDESEEMLNAAHDAAHHWNRVGTGLNAARAKTLLAEVHALCGFGESSLSLATEVKDYFRNREVDDWERAFVHAIHAHAASVAGHDDAHRDSYLAAQRAIESISDEEDKKIVLQTFVQIPKPR